MTASPPLPLGTFVRVVDPANERTQALLGRTGEVVGLSDRGDRYWYAVMIEGICWMLEPTEVEPLVGEVT